MGLFCAKFKTIPYHNNAKTLQAVKHLFLTLSPSSVAYIDKTCYIIRILTMKGAYMTTTTTGPVAKSADICDDCALIAYDNGIGIINEWDREGTLDEFDKAEAGAWQAQVEFMVDAGAMVTDHACSAKTEPDLNIQCDCGCRRN